MITEDYVSFETAKFLKEREFDEETRGYYPVKGDATGRLMFGIEYDHNHSQVQISAPTLQMAIKWLREVHNISIEPYVDFINNNEYQWAVDVAYIKKNGLIDITYGGSYEQACEAAIKYCLENLLG